MMKQFNRLTIPLLMVLLLIFAAAPAGAQVLIQCPCDRNGDGDCEDILASGPPADRYDEPLLAMDLGVQCMHLSGGDGFATMADGRVQYMFSFADLTGIGDGYVLNAECLGNNNPDPCCTGLMEGDCADGDISDDIMAAGALAAAWPAPAITLDEGKKFYLTLSNVGMLIRPDLFDPHTVHFHGFPQSSSVFDGLPESGLSINMGASLTYFYELHDPGTYMYHCHVEATEHMQMGMLGNLYVRAGQSFNGDSLAGVPAGNLGLNDGQCNTTDDNPLVPCGYAYNDGDGSTAYDVEYPLQLGSFDPEFHDASWFVQPLPFAMMFDTYPMINGRGYPDTIDPDPLPTPTDMDNCDGSCNGGVESQVESSLVTATAGQKVLLRLSNLNITATHTLISPSIPMRVVGIDAKELVAADGTTKLHYTTNSVTMGGGMSADVILDTTGVTPGDYYIYASNLQYLANNDEVAPLGGMMTKIVIQ
jgi:FtsP/CotA-like multicopper oxidase with cupredoxin domain